MIKTEQLFGTKLRGTIEQLNSEPEHMRIGLSWSIFGDFLDIESGPAPDANLANSHGVCEELAKHIESCGVNIEWTYNSGKRECFEVRPNSVKKVLCRKVHCT